MSHQPSTSQVVQGTPLVSTGYTLQHEYFARLFLATTQTGRRVLKKVLLVILPRVRVSNLPSPICVRDYFISILGWSNTTFKRNFNAMERQVLEEPVNSADMDVTLLSKAIQKLTEILNVTQELKDAVKDVKDMRNKVCHESLQLDKNQLTTRMADLKIKFGTLIHHVENVFGIQINRSTYDAEVDAIESSPIDVSDYFKHNIQYRLHLVNKFKTSGQVELRESYSKLQTFNPFIWLSSDTYPQLHVEKIFTDPSITEENRNIKSSSLLTTEKIDTTGDMIPKVLLLSGIAGSGKTSLCRFLLNDWRTQVGKVTNLNSMDIVLYIEARNKTTRSLLTFLQTNLLTKTCKRFEEKIIHPIVGDLKVLYIIDGMDEATIEAMDLIANIFSLASGSDKSRILITTRPECESDVIQLSVQYSLSILKLKIHGFTEEGTEIFISRAFSVFFPDQNKCRREKEQFLNVVINLRRSLPDPLSLPLTLAFLVCLWQDDKQSLENINSGTKIYFKIFKMLTSRLMTRLRKNILGYRKHIEKKVELCLSALAEKSFKMLKRDILVIDDEAQDQICRQLEAQGLPEVEVLSAFLHCELYTDLLGVHHHFSFLHKTHMEYLAGLYISDTVMKENKSRGSNETIKEEFLKLGLLKDMDRSWNCKWLNTWPYVIGHLCLREADDNVLNAVVEALFSTQDMEWPVDTVWRLVQESGMHRQVIDKTGSSMTCDNTVWRPDSRDVNNPNNSLAMLLRSTPITPSSVWINLDFGAPLITDESLNTAACENLENIFMLLSQRPSCEVVLWLPYLCLSDKYDLYRGIHNHVMNLIPSAMNLVELRGSLGPEGVTTALIFFDKIRKLYVTVDKAETLHVMAETLRQRNEEIKEIYLHLRLSLDSLPALPRLTTPSLSVYLYEDVHDGNATSVASTLSQLSLRYYYVCLMKSGLAADGIVTFASALHDRKVTVTDRLVVPPRRFNPKQLEQVKKMLGCRLG